MNPLKVLGLLFVAGSLTPAQALADEDFHGIIEQRPEGNTGTWIIGGQEVAVTDKTKIEEDDGPLAVGKCAEVEYENGRVEEIESESLSDCRK
ncbi:DUF5666 domain-containing protein [Methylomagnum sp.]